MQKIAVVTKDFDKEKYFVLIDNDQIKVGDFVVATFDELKTIAKVENFIDKKDDFEDLPFAKIAKPTDIELYNKLKEKTKKQLVLIKKKSRELKLDMKFVGAVQSFDDSKILIIFSSEERIDFRQFLKDLASMLKMRIELKQIGQRDEIKIVGGVGPCGEVCCCTRFLKDFEHVTVKMAKVQGLSLTPTKINGLCGRLKCCLGYESSQYDEILSKMPKINSEVLTKNGKGITIYNDVLRERVTVKRQTDLDSFVVEDYSLNDIKILNNNKKN